MAVGRRIVERSVRHSDPTRAKKLKEHDSAAGGGVPQYALAPRTHVEYARPLPQDPPRATQAPAGRPSKRRFAELEESSPEHHSAAPRRYDEEHAGDLVEDPEALRQYLDDCKTTHQQRLADLENDPGDHEADIESEKDTLAQIEEMYYSTMSAVTTPSPDHELHEEYTGVLTTTELDGLIAGPIHGDHSPSERILTYDNARSASASAEGAADQANKEQSRPEAVASWSARPVERFNLMTYMVTNFASSITDLINHPAYNIEAESLKQEGEGLRLKAFEIIETGKAFAGTAFMPAESNLNAGFEDEEVDDLDNFLAMFDEAGQEPTPDMNNDQFWEFESRLIFQWQTICAIARMLVAMPDDPLTTNPQKAKQRASLLLRAALMVQLDRLKAHRKGASEFCAMAKQAYHIRFVQDAYMYQKLYDWSEGCLSLLKGVSQVHGYTIKRLRGCEGNVQADEAMELLQMKHQAEAWMSYLEMRQNMSVIEQALGRVRVIPDLFISKQSVEKKPITCEIKQEPVEDETVAGSRLMKVVRSVCVCGPAC